MDKNKSIETLSGEYKSVAFQNCEFENGSLENITGTFPRVLSVNIPTERMKPEFVPSMSCLKSEHSQFGH